MATPRPKSRQTLPVTTREKLEAAVAAGKPFKAGVTFSPEEMRELLLFMQEHELHELSTAVKGAVRLAVTTGPKSSVLQKMKHRAAVHEIRVWYFRELSIAVGRINEELREMSQGSIDELAALAEEIANHTPEE